jgi:hypothetical protein
MTGRQLISFRKHPQSRAWSTGVGLGFFARNVLLLRGGK